MAGYSSADEYYDHCNPMRTVDNIKNPCLFINSEDDPLCVIQNVTESLDSIKRSSHCIVCVTKTGSHLPFYEGLFFNSWATQATYEFFDVVLTRTV
jgi:predicted alpha/beta-fold hydrolase